MSGLMKRLLLEVEGILSIRSNRCNPSRKRQGKKDVNTSRRFIDVRPRSDECNRPCPDRVSGISDRLSESAAEKYCLVAISLIHQEARALREPAE